MQKLKTYKLTVVSQTITLSIFTPSYKYVKIKKKFVKSIQIYTVSTVVFQTCLCFDNAIPFVWPTSNWI